MGFCSILFLYTFLPLSVLMFWLVPKKARPGTLLAFNLLFGLFAGLWRGPALLLFPLLDYGAARWMEKSPSVKKRKRAAAFLSFFYFSLLAASFISQWSGMEQGLWMFLPLYFSCWALRSVAYLWDVARKEIPAESNFLRYLTYQTLFFFPTGGPVVLYQECAGGLFPAQCPWDKLSQGLRRLIRGLGKTLLLGSSLMEFWRLCSENGTAGALWFGLAGCGLGIYFLFSGFSDLSIGIGSLFGLNFPENFDHPFLSASIGEFLSRWQKTLARWGYRYFPKGGRSSTRLLLFLPLWALTGLLQGGGWNLLLWGLYIGLLLGLEQLLRNPLPRLSRWMGCIATFLLLLPGWILFSQRDTAGIRECLLGLTGQSPSGLWDNQTSFLLLHNGVLLVLGGFFAGPWTGRWMGQLESRNSTFFQVLLSLGYVVLLALSTAYLIGAGPAVLPSL